MVGVSLSSGKLCSNVPSFVFGFYRMITWGIGATGRNHVFDTSVIDKRSFIKEFYCCPLESGFEVTYLM